jgi:2-polyprenyl-3-methyl-5-hydroxy-6-metoxy-1,4-benzoquinol methylase
MKDVSECPVCGHHEFRELFASNYSGTVDQAAAYFLTDRAKAVHGRIVRCGRCSFVLTSPQYGPEQYDQLYREVAKVERPVGRTRAVSARYQRLAERVGGYVKDGRFLDFGCGDGHFLDHMPQFQAVGLELRSGVASGTNASDGRIIVGELEPAVMGGLLKPASFDFITTWDVLEHLPMLTRDVGRLRGLLKPGGWLFCSVPNVASLAAKLSGERWNCYLLEHLWYFSPATLSAFFERQGFATHTVRPFLFPADVATLASRVEQTYGLRLPVPNAIAAWTLPLPAGVMFGAFQLKA